MGLQRSTTVVALDHAECFGDIAWEEDETELNVPTFIKLKSASSPSAFKNVSPSTKTPLKLDMLRLLSIPLFLLPCIATQSHSPFEQLGFECLWEVVGSDIVLNEEGYMDSLPHYQRLIQFMWWAVQAKEVQGEAHWTVTPLVDPSPSIVTWRDNIIASSIEPQTSPPQQLGPSESIPTSGDVSTKLVVEVMGALKDTMDSIALKETQRRRRMAPKAICKVAGASSETLLEAGPCPRNLRRPRTLREWEDLHGSVLNGQRSLSPEDGPSPEVWPQCGLPTRLRPGPQVCPAHLGRPLNA
jgi:hypothetical protein